MARKTTIRNESGLDEIPDEDGPILPATPGVTSGYIEDDLRALADLVSAFDLASMSAKNNNAGKGRRNLASGWSAGALISISSNSPAQNFPANADCVMAMLSAQPGMLG